MKIVTSYWAKPIPSRRFDWQAVTDNYDGAEDSSNRNQIGFGATEAEAIKDLLAVLEDNCPGHVASKADAKICDRCGLHIDSLRPPCE